MTIKLLCLSNFQMNLQFWTRRKNGIYAFSYEKTLHEAKYSSPKTVLSEVVGYWIHHFLCSQKFHLDHFHFLCNQKIHHSLYNCHGMNYHIQNFLEIFLLNILHDSLPMLLIWQEPLEDHQDLKASNHNFERN